MCVQTLLREVHQEGMQVLSLSELPLPEGEPGSQSDAPGWLKERDALLATVESLKGLVTQMQTHREAQVDEPPPGFTKHRFLFVRARVVLVALRVRSRLYLRVSDSLQTSGGVDWRAELLDAVRQVFVRERSLLKSALYSQLDLLDTSDAIIHLNQLEHRLAEQVQNHKLFLLF